MHTFESARAYVEALRFHVMHARQSHRLAWRAGVAGYANDAAALRGHARAHMAQAWRLKARNRQRMIDRLTAD